MTSTTASTIPDPIRSGLQRGWRVRGGAHGPLPARITCDVAIIGSGAGAGITAELLTHAGLQVVLVEEGPLKSSSDFRQLESEAYPSLYQESAGRKTADKAITILQGRCVGGSTTVNWTSSFRTPPTTLEHWQQHFGLTDYTEAALAPWFAQAEQRLNIGPWLTPANRNNEVLRAGARRLGISAAGIQRNVKGCWNLGSCGMGCPTNAKQSMLVTTIPTALDRGATLLVETRADAFVVGHGQVQALVCTPVAGNGAPVHGAAPTRIVARHFVVAGGAINSPALLMRSGVPDPHRLLGKRTFLHPVVISAATFDERVEAWSGAPQTLYSDHFLHSQPIDGPMGYKLEAPPMHPVIVSTTLTGHGQAQADLLKQFPQTQGLLALLRDGFHADSPGGTVQLRDDGSPVLDYPLNDYVMDGARRAFLSMAEIQFAAGARQVSPVHEMARQYTSWAQAREAIQALPMKPLLTRVVSAHVMGGCAMAGHERQGVVRPDGVHWQLANLSVHDGSLFPTSIGANPQLSVYGVANRLATGLAMSLTGRDVQLVA
ncbi:GMC family oxidoreductase [Piscinibacter gummiphilus]|uniref:GMC family oxidoreductase n=1 Tax=Piscinibacter gummiphilus TaxID=946333 RepID=A0ABZ0CVP8_9BURK|nr:GMC family oxidoreductase [Piscinibacter gummiphilus]WOB08963.1 GMC family oxidoreductase [Piscinibacter gummiphilus]